MSVAIAFTDGSPASEFVNTTTGEVTTTVAGGTANASATLAAVPRAAENSFEGSQVGMTEIKISGTCAIETAGDLTVSLDDMVRAVGVYRVTKVLHYVHPKTGETVRQQVLTPVEGLMVVPWDSSNPSDDGIVRARP